MSYSSSYFPRSYAYTKPNPPVGASSGSSIGSTTERPATLNLSSTVTNTLLPAGVPTKPSRYTPNLSANQPPPKSSSYTSIPTATTRPTTLEPASTYASSYAANRVGYGRKPQQQEVITVPPKSSVTLGYGRDREGTSPYYQTQMASYRSGIGQGGQLLNVNTSAAPTSCGGFL